MSQTLAPVPALPMGIDRHITAPPPPSPTRRAAEYRTVFGIPAVVDPATGQITMRAGAIVGVMLPAELGKRLRATLEHSRERGGPILAHPRSKTWTILTRRDQPTENITARTRSWWRDRVLVLTANAVIGLPGPHASGATHREWIVAPHNRQCPATSTVIDALRAILPKCGPR